MESPSSMTRGYVYQIYQSALAWAELKDDEFLYLEVAEDFAKVAEGALEAVQVKETSKTVPGIDTGGSGCISRRDIFQVIYRAFQAFIELNPYVIRPSGVVRAKTLAHSVNHVCPFT